MKNPSIVIIGGGNMGTALVRVVSAIPSKKKKSLLVEKNSIKRRKLNKQFGIRTSKMLTSELLQHARIIILAVKPQDAPPILAPIRKYHHTRTTLVSIMAGVTIASLKRATGIQRVMRIMPNLPATVGHGFSAWCATASVSRSDREVIIMLLRAMGIEKEVSAERWLDAVTAISGSGPAYVFYFIELLTDAARSFGFTESMARAMVVSTIRGSLALLEKTGDDPAALRQRVTSKGGTTAVALKHLMTKNQSQLWKRAITAAHRRSKTLSKELDRTIRRAKVE